MTIRLAITGDDMHGTLSAGLAERIEVVFRHSAAAAFAARPYSGAARALILPQDYYRHRDLVTALLHREDGLAPAPHPYRAIHDLHDRFDILADTLAGELVDSGATHCLFLSPPQQSCETLLYLVARALGLRTIVLIPAPVPGHVFSTPTLEATGNFPVDPAAVPLLPAPTQATAATQAQSAPGLLAMARLGAFLLRHRPLRALDPAYLRRSIATMRRPDGALADWRDPYARFFHTHPLAWFDHLAGRDRGNTGATGDFVYVPLQSPRTLAAATLGGRFHDQAYMIERLAGLLPTATRILVHPCAVPDPDLDGPLFFHRLRRIPSVTLLPSGSDTAALIARARLVATVSADAGWHALFAGKPVLVFGAAWYASLPGAHRFHGDLAFARITAPDDPTRAMGALMARAHDTDSLAETLPDLLDGRRATTFA